MGWQDLVFDSNLLVSVKRVRYAKGEEWYSHRAGLITP